MKFNAYLRKKLKNSKFKKSFDAFDMPVRLAAEIVRAREKANLTQKQLGEAVSMSQSAIARLEAGDEINPEFQTILRIAHALRPHFSFIIGETKKIAA